MFHGNESDEEKVDKDAMSRMEEKRKEEGESRQRSWSDEIDEEREKGKEKGKKEKGSKD